MRRAIRLRVGDKIWIDDGVPYTVLGVRVLFDTVGPPLLVNVQREAGLPEIVLSFYDDDMVRVTAGTVIAGVA
jgi:hypothetical protein